MPASSRPELLSCLYQAIVECLTCHKLGAGVERAYSLKADADMYDAIFSTQIKLSANGQLDGLDGPVEFVEHAIIQQFTAEDQSQQQEQELEPTEMQDETVAQPNEADTETFSNQLEEFSRGQEQVEHAVPQPSASEAEEPAVEQPADVLTSKQYEQVIYYAVPNESFLAAKLDVSQPITFSVSLNVLRKNCSARLVDLTYPIIRS